MSGESVPELLVKLRMALYQQFNVVVSRVKLYTRNDPKHPLCLPVPDGILAPQEPAREQPAAERVGATERRILRAVADLDVEEPTGEEIAVKAKLRYESHLRKLLAAMRTRGLLGGGRGDAGYPITPKGLDALNEKGQEP